MVPNQIDLSEKFAQKVLQYVEGKNMKIVFGTINGDEETDLIDRFT